MRKIHDLQKLSTKEIVSAGQCSEKFYRFLGKENCMINLVAITYSLKFYIFIIRIWIDTTYIFLYN